MQEGSHHSRMHCGTALAWLRTVLFSLLTHSFVSRIVALHSRSLSFLYYTPLLYDYITALVSHYRHGRRYPRNLVARRLNRTCALFVISFTSAGCASSVGGLCTYEVWWWMDAGRCVAPILESCYRPSPHSELQDNHPKAKHNVQRSETVSGCAKSRLPRDVR
jgi:hypothetical protein